ncbi:transglutaminase TgpA family protein [Listeria valentina]|uniref:transglutaminase TgpA family protein n=1 Tax=Listeria valentina TaxID=2705293 RepID=UPI0014302386|nr:transglutaminaseTgpA domain-containing protein [Listeria valentina]
MGRKMLKFLLYVLAILLISEWVFPFSYLTETGYSIWMVAFIALSLGCFFIGLRFYYSIPLHLLAIALLMAILFNSGNLADPSFYAKLTGTAIKGTGSLFQLDATKIGDEFIFMTFLIALWLLAYITAYSLLKKGRILSILALTVIYIAVINTFTDYKGELALVRTVVIGFVLLHLTLTARLGASQLDSPKRSLVYHTSLLAVLAIMIGIALSLPVHKPIWNDPVPYIKQALGMDTTRTVGYSEDDTELGGALDADYSEVFQVTSKRPHYWRVESKRTYTGKGWASPSTTDTESFASSDEFPVNLNENYAEQTEQATIRFTASNDYLVYAYGTQNVESAAGPFRYTASNEKVTPQGSIKKYALEIKTPIYDIRKMKEAPFASLSDEFTERYTQLPNGLPKRVKSLANRLTEKESNTYEKVKAIERYLSFSGKFRYSTEDAEETKRGADYVDQFLFETKVGYCDNFSTSMIVMLRSLGIPARFAKGFTSGDAAGKDGANTIYKVQNNNAHSWPEVYFPGTGWVPFEPTATFQNPEAFTNTAGDQRSDTNTNNQAENRADTPAKQDQPTQNEDRSQKQQESKTKQEGAKQETTSQAKPFQLPSFVYWILGGVAVLLLAFLVAKRKALLLRYFRWQIEHDKLSFDKAYRRLLKLFAETRNPSETLTDFAARIEIPAFTELTRQYEAHLYGGKAIQIEQVAPAFLNIIQVLQTPKKRRKP